MKEEIASRQTAAPWWHGTVIPTGRYRLKRGQWRDQEFVLQHMITDTSGHKKRWVSIELADENASDDG